LSLVAVVALAACSGDGDSAAPTPPPSPPVEAASPAPAVTVTETVAPPSPPTPSAQPSPATSRSPEAGGCPSNGLAAPESAGGELVGDFDGDGASDRVGFDTDGTLTFSTASGFVSSLELGLPPNRRALAVADPQRDGQTFVFLAAYPREVSDSEVVDITLASLVDCEPVVLTDSDGETYVIEYRSDGEHTGLGFGCTDADGDGRRDLVGLVQERQSDGSIRYERTIISLDGTTASSGRVDEGVAAPDAPLASCGEQVFAVD